MNIVEGILINALYDIAKQLTKPLHHSAKDGIQQQLLDAFNSALKLLDIDNDSIRKSYLDRLSRFVANKPSTDFAFTSNELAKILQKEEKFAKELLQLFEFEIIEKDEKLYRWMQHKYLNQIVLLLSTLLKSQKKLKKTLPEIRDDSNSPNGKFSENLYSLVSHLFVVLDKTSETSDSIEVTWDYLFGLYVQLLKLQVIIEEVGKLSDEEAEELWVKMSDGGIDLRSEMSALSRKYLSCMRELTNTFKYTVRRVLLIQIPEVAESISKIWDVKIELYQLLSGEKADKDSSLKLLRNEDYFSILEGVRTLESHVLHQVIDQEARIVARDFETGLTIFGELVRNKDRLQNFIMHARNNLAQFISLKYQ